VVWQKFTDVSDKYTASVFGVEQYAELLAWPIREQKLQTIRSSEMWRNFYKTTRRHITEDSPLAMKLSRAVSRVKMKRISASVPDDGGSDSFTNVGSPFQFDTAEKKNTWRCI
jgi:hypothetical protein